MLNQADELAYYNSLGPQTKTIYFNIIRGVDESWSEEGAVQVGLKYFVSYSSEEYNVPKNELNTLYHAIQAHRDSPVEKINY